jgi:ABC-2 type transport system ATP-binding protein
MSLTVPALSGDADASAVVFEQVSKWFGPVVAVSDVSFTIGSGVTSILGPNGAGKSTVMRLLCGLTKPSTGIVQVYGKDPRVDPGIYRQLGLVPQQETVIEPITCLQFVTLAAQLSDVKNPKQAAIEAVRKVELDPDDKRPIGSYSKGMRQRAKVASAIVHQPRLLVLDEPLNGLDPRQRARMIELFTELGMDGRSVIVTSHVLEEIERFGSRIILIAEGRLAAEGEYTQIRALMDDRPLRVRIDCDDPRLLASELMRSESLTAVSLTGESVIADVVNAPLFRRLIARVCQEQNLDLREVVPLDDDLESVFRYLVSRRH